MRRRDLVIGLPITLVAASGRAFSQQTQKLPHIGVLVSASPPHPFAEAFWRGLRPLGYSEGKNIDVELHYTGGRSERAEELADELVRRGVDVIVAHFTPAVRAALGATRIIPIVMAPAGAPLQSGFVQSLAHPAETSPACRQWMRKSGANACSSCATSFRDLPGSRFWHRTRTRIRSAGRSWRTSGWRRGELGYASSRCWSAALTSLPALSPQWLRLRRKQLSFRDSSIRTGLH